MYDHNAIEQKILSFWEKEEIYQKVKDNNRKNEIFYFCDGPPYATGQIHPGTGWNKTIKDSVCRYQRGIGKNVRAQIGYDTHGLPIEVKVEKELGIKNKNEIEKLGIEKFIKECKKFATKYIGIMNGQFKSLGVWMDYDNPYITYNDDFINASWHTLKMAWEKKLMHEGEYVLPYCYRCETTMANYELEYGEESDPSIFIKFKVKERENEYLIVWTTTPWTLIANMGVMVHPIFSYVKVKVGEEIWVLAKERMEYMLNILGESGVVVEEVSGKKLEGTAYEHPFQDKIKKEFNRKVVLSDEYVTLEEGTGLVHTAPGHGPEDFIIGKRFGIEPFSPVDERGNFTEEAGIFKGKNVRESSKDVINVLKEKKVLIYQDRIKHRYPHCWRCKTPLIFLATKQWFINISNIKSKMMDEIEKIDWHPSFIKNRFADFVSGAPDWCISRQRYWGIPLPIWKCKECESITVIGDRNEIGKVKELHRPYVDEIKIDCSCGKKMERIPDVLDVWFDSGNAVWASLDEKESKMKELEQTHVIIEGQDQIRGWFYSLLGSGIIRYDKSPYKKLLMHGFFVDEKGEKMSKSLGNFVPLEEILTKYGADGFRLWGLSSTVWE
ncbi:MAG: isoleucine--tRNA ligase [Candidatus ainarchaeum sp.]|nr:isoleucine--tRNA ligase [Candidatus ainarchaeum sp.]